MNEIREPTIKMWAPWHPEYGFGDAGAASAFGNIDEAIRLNTAKRIMDDDERWKVVSVVVIRAPLTASAGFRSEYEEIK